MYLLSVMIVSERVPIFGRQTGLLATSHECPELMTSVLLRTTKSYRVTREPYNIMLSEITAVLVYEYFLKTVIDPLRYSRVLMMVPCIGTTHGRKAFTFFFR